MKYLSERDFAGVVSVVVQVFVGVRLVIDFLLFETIGLRKSLVVQCKQKTFRMSE